MSRYMSRGEAMAWAVEQILDGRRPAQRAPGHAHGWAVVVSAKGWICDSCGLAIEEDEANACAECGVVWCVRCVDL